MEEILGALGEAVVDVLGDIVSGVAEIALDMLADNQKSDKDENAR
jgi:hypothetical protein